MVAWFAVVLLPNAAGAQETGILELKCNVQEAMVFIDGEIVGEAPYLEILDAGRHQIRVERSGFQSFEQIVTIRPDTALEVFADLLRIDPGLEVRIDVETAKVYLDGQHVGTGSSVVVDPVPPGSHELVVEADQFGSWKGMVNLAPGTLTPVEVQLRGSLGSVEVHTDPEGARVVFDGRDYGLTPATIDPVDSGSHWIRLSKEGFSDVLQALVVDSGRRVTVDASLVSEGGTLVVRPSVERARVFLNGVEVGAGRQEVGPIKPGLYSVRVTAAGHTDFIKTVQVGAGKKVSVAARLAGFDYGRGPRLGASVADSRPVVQRPAFWAVLGGGVAAGLTAALVAAGTSASSGDSTSPASLEPPATDYRFALP